MKSMDKPKTAEKKKPQKRSRKSVLKNVQKRNPKKAE